MSNESLVPDTEIPSLFREIDKWRTRAQTAEAQVAELEQFTYCAYCNKQFTLDDEAAAKVTEHIYTCGKHPMRDVEQERDRLREALESISTKLTGLESRHIAEDALDKIRDGGKP